jgi:hypothetical protein
MCCCRLSSIFFELVLTRVMLMPWVPLLILRFLMLVLIIVQPIHFDEVEALVLRVENLQFWNRVDHSR